MILCDILLVKMVRQKQPLAGKFFFFQLLMKRLMTRSPQNKLKTLDSTQERIPPIDEETENYLGESDNSVKGKRYEKTELF